MYGNLSDRYLKHAQKTLGLGAGNFIDGTRSIGIGTMIHASLKIEPLLDDKLRDLLGPILTEDQIYENRSNTYQNNWLQHGQGAPKGLGVYTPQWDGEHIVKTLRPWLKDMRLLRKYNVHPLHEHGYLLCIMIGKKRDGWLRHIADTIEKDNLLDFNGSFLRHKTHPFILGKDNSS